MRYSVTTPVEHDVEILLFRDVANVGEVVTKMLNGTFEAALVNASMVPDLFVALVAVSSALRRFDDGEKLTRNIYTSILYQLSPTRNISQALKTFGISNSSTDILVVVPDATDEKLKVIRDHLHSASEVDASQLAQIHSERSLKSIQDFYAIEASELTSSTLVDSIVSRMACRDVK